MSPGLRKALLSLTGASALTIASVMVPELEGVRYTPYQDVVGVLTVCYGHTGEDIIADKRYSQAECEKMLNDDLQPFSRAVERAVTVPADEYQKAALISFSYNVGISAFEHSSVLRYLNAGETEKACAGLKQWIWAGGRKWQGLINRREVEDEDCHWQRRRS